MTYRFIIILLLLPLSLNYGESAKQPVSTSDSIPIPATVVMPVYEIDSTCHPESLALNPGDSVYIYGDELYYRARTGGRECFVSCKGILSHADSLVVYRNLRFAPGGTSISDSLPVKVERQRCSMITKNGARCKRQALPGSDRCWQHKR
jgi:hypothetical protein